MMPQGFTAGIIKKYFLPAENNCRPSSCSRVCTTILFAACQTLPTSCRLCRLLLYCCALFCTLLLPAPCWWHTCHLLSLPLVPSFKFFPLLQGCSNWFFPTGQAPSPWFAFTNRLLYYEPVRPWLTRIGYFWPRNLCCLYLFTRFPFIRLRSCLRSLLPVRSAWHYQVLLFHCLACVSVLPSLYRTPYSPYQFISAVPYHNMRPPEADAFDVYFQVFDTASKVLRLRRINSLTRT